MIEMKKKIVNSPGLGYKFMPGEYYNFVPHCKEEADF